MRLGWTKNKNSTTYRALKTIRVDGKNKTLVIKTFGSDKFICETYGVTDAKAWAKEQVLIMNEAEKEEEPSFAITLRSSVDLPPDTQRCFNGGYLFLQQVYYELGLDKICAIIRTRHKFSYNLNSILSRLIYTRILYPASKLSSYKDSKRFIEQPNFELHQIYRALSVLAAESDYIQARLFKNSMAIGKRRTEVIYYDCTNFYFEIEQAEDDNQYGVSKENRPLPIVETGLFMDRDGIPLAFCINPGNENEQQTLIPLEKKLMEKFDMSQFIVCTDAGLSSNTNRYFNNYGKEDGSRDFITAQSVEKLKANLKQWALASDGWRLPGSDGRATYNIDHLDEEKCLDRIYYKSRWFKEKVEVTIDGQKKKVELEQQLIVTYSIKYRNYLRFIKANHATKDGETAEYAAYYIDEDAIAQEEKYDGFYAMCTSLEDGAESIIKVNQRRWEIEECFRIMKSEFQARPVYLKLQDRIVAHFITCFISLILYRYLEKKLNNKYTIGQIVDTLQEMNFIKYEGKGYQPTYTRTEVTDALHEAFSFCTSKEIVPVKIMKKICADTKRQRE